MTSQLYLSVHDRVTADCVNYFGGYAEMSSRSRGCGIIRESSLQVRIRY